jgi:hypothetical protein
MAGKFPIGQLVATRGVANLIEESAEFSRFAKASFARYLNADWGEMCESDKRQNEDALKHNDNRIFAAYENAAHPAWKLWIITEWDHSATTLLFPSEY